MQVRFQDGIREREKPRESAEIWGAPERHEGIAAKRKRETCKAREKLAGEEKRDGRPVSRYGKERDEMNVRSRTEAKQERRSRLYRLLHGRVNMCNLDTVLARRGSIVFLLKNDAARAAI